MPREKQVIGGKRTACRGGSWGALCIQCRERGKRGGGGEEGREEERGIEKKFPFENLADEQHEGGKGGTGVKV